MLRIRPWIYRLTFWLLLLSAVALGAQASSIYLKAWLAQALIANAWQQSLTSGQPVKPWPWADTWPVAAIHWSALAEPLYVMNAAGGEGLAFGPALVEGSPQPEQGGDIVIGGHRDTHFRGLQTLKTEDRIELTDQRGRHHRYRVSRIHIVDSGKDPLIPANRNGLTLITCYPFEALIPGGPLRYVVEAEPDENWWAIPVH
ncbi:class GN sortase [Pokkaliibacter plantistimulans]|uniref:Class GN sortase n=1 Tax=Proteobacteria bacterium 228 TaxID=2083153 RepID=A0A2S5KTG4_9PROT|nr:class GN sortase [Pokkaliibacter plantistimulans]PPC78147.1 class GN sortase [Pokkaliibacter plantistimulans]